MFTTHIFRQLVAGAALLVSACAALAQPLSVEVYNPGDPDFYFGLDTLTRVSLVFGKVISPSENRVIRRSQGSVPAWV